MDTRDNMSSSSSDITYRPTPLERAYASYLLETYFDIPFNNTTTSSSNSGVDEEEIRLSGRTAVPFLTTSNVPRTTLRLLWNVVDPTNIGTLTTKTQFYTLLRLIAMSQAHFLPPLSSSSTTNGANNNNNNNNGSNDLENDIQIIKVTLENNKHLIVALPTFDADNSNCPSVAALMGKYNNNNITSSSSAVGGSNGSLPALDFSNGGVGMIDGVLLGRSNNNEKLSVSDAFGQLQIVEDLPLAPLQPAPPPPVEVADEVIEESIATVETNTAKGGEEDDFGNFEGVQESVSAGDEDDFGDFDNAPSPHVEGGTEFTSHGNNEEEEEQVLTSNDAVSNDNEQMEQLNSEELVEEEEDFGGFAVAISGHDDIKTESSAADDNNGEENSDFGSFGDAGGTEDDGIALGQNNVVTALATTTTSALSLNDSDDAALGNNDEGHNMLSISDAVDPSVIVVQENDTNVGGGMDESNNNNVASSANPLAAADLERSVDELGTFPEQAPVCNSSERLSVFDALVDVQDAPLPSLGGAFTSSTSSSNNDDMAESENVEEDNDFGDSPDNGNEIAADDVQHTGLLEEVHEEADHFGDFEGTFGEEKTDENEVEIGDIQDGLGEVDNFGDFDCGENTELGDNVVGDFGMSSEISDNFGDFGGAATDEVTAGEEKAELTSNHEGGVEIITKTVQLNGNISDKGLSVFDALTEVQDAPLPPLETYPSMSEEAGDLTNDEFGDFEASDQIAAAAENNELFGETDSDKEIREEAYEASLPSNTEAENFGDFEGTNTIMENVESAPAIESSDDLFDAFSSSNTPLPTSEILNEASFGAFEGHGDSNSLVCHVDSNILATREEEVEFGNFNADAEDPNQVGGDLFAGHVGAGNTVINANDAEGEFGGFDAFADTEGDSKIHVAKEDDTDTEANKGESFGEFGDFPPVTNEAANKSSYNDFGQFETTSPVIDDNEDESFSQFNDMGTNNDTDFGAFDETGTTQLPEDAVSGNAVPDEAFEDGFGDFSSFDEGATSQLNDKSKDLEDLLRSKLGDEFSRLAADWKNVIVSAVEHDMQRGIKILDYMLSDLSSRDRALVTKSKKLREYILSLGEMVRLVRYITATIGELLCVDKNIEVKESTLSQWDDNDVIADAIVIDYLWSEIVAKAARMDIELPKLESVVEIRSGALSVDSHQRGNFCELTLWPLTLKEDVTTVSPVSWKGKRYMACAANFCANRLPVQAAESY